MQFTSFDTVHSSHQFTIANVDKYKIEVSFVVCLFFPSSRSYFLYFLLYFVLRTKNAIYVVRRNSQFTIAKMLINAKLKFRSFVYF